MRCACCWALSNNAQRVVSTKVTRRQYELHYFIFAARYNITNKPCDIDKSVIFGCAKNIPVMLERNCPTLSQTSNMKLSYIGILHFHNTDDCITRILRHDVTFCMWHFGIGLWAEYSVGLNDVEWCGYTATWRRVLHSALVYERNIPSVWNDVEWCGYIATWRHVLHVVFWHWFIRGMFRRFQMMWNDAGDSPSVECRGCLVWRLAIL